MIHLACVNTMRSYEVMIHLACVNTMRSYEVPKFVYIMLARALYK